MKLKGTIYFLTKNIYLSHFRDIPIFPEQLMQTKLPIITQEECNTYFPIPIPNDEICTFDASRRRAACKGDIGGPLVYQDRLLGLLRFTVERPWTHPDVFFNLNDNEIHQMVDIHMNIVRGAH